MATPKVIPSKLIGIRSKQLRISSKLLGIRSKLLRIQAWLLGILSMLRGIPIKRLGIPSKELGILSKLLGIPSKLLGIPSKLLPSRACDWPGHVMSPNSGPLLCHEIWLKLLGARPPHLHSRWCPNHPKPKLIAAVALKS